MHKRKANGPGFTIVELLIVIVVIAILATISIMTYNGIQQRAKNAKTVSAVIAYVKALKLYKVDNGQYPGVNSCLGVGYANGKCHSTGAYIENELNFNMAYLAPYLGSSVPTPALNLGQYDSTVQLGGAIYVWNNTGYGGVNNGGIGLYSQGDGDCPSIGNLTLVSSSTYSDSSGKLCRYSIDQAIRGDRAARPRSPGSGKAARSKSAAPAGGETRAATATTPVTWAFVPLLPLGGFVVFVLG